MLDIHTFVMLDDLASTVPAEQPSRTTVVNAVFNLKVGDDFRKDWTLGRVVVPHQPEKVLLILPERRRHSWTAGQNIPTTLTSSTI